MKHLSKEVVGGLSFVGLWLCVFVLVAFGTGRIGHAQEKPVDKPPAARQIDGGAPAKPAEPVKPPTMPAETGIELRDAVLTQAKLMIQFRDTITSYNKLQSDMAAQAKVIDDKKKEALKNAHLDLEKWDVDLDKFAFVPRAAPEKKP
jgi:hypothetical protein